MGVTGPLINFTATFSYAICMACSRFKSNPALGQMAVLDDAMRNPAQYGCARACLGSRWALRHGGGHQAPPIQALASLHRRVQAHLASPDPPHHSARKSGATAGGVRTG